MIRTFINWWKRRKAEAYRDWASVPPPNYNCSRGKQTNAKYGDYW